MSKRGKWLCGIGVAAILGISVAIVAIQRTRQVVVDAYALWAAAELVIAHHKTTGTLPASWQALEAYMPQTSPGTHLGFCEISERVEIDFARLPELRQHYPTPETMPQVITARNGSSTRPARSGSNPHWRGAEPSALVNQALLNQALLNQPANDSGEPPANAHSRSRSHSRSDTAD